MLILSFGYFRSAELISPTSPGPQPEASRRVPTGDGITVSGAHQQAPSLCGGTHQRKLMTTERLLVGAMFFLWIKLNFVVSNFPPKCLVGQQDGASL